MLQPLEDWISTKQAEPFLKAARAVLNGQVYCVPLLAPRPLDRANLIETAYEITSDPELEGPLTRAVIEEDPGLTGLIRCPYRPPETLRAFASPMDERGARRRLAAMLLPQPPYRSPYDRSTPQDRAVALVTSFLEAFEPQPTLFAEVDRAILDHWMWIESLPPSSAHPDGVADRDTSVFADGMFDSVMVLANDARVALLVNNGGFP